MNLQDLLLTSYERGIDDAASFLRLSITLVLPFAGFPLLLVALRALFKPPTSAHSTQVQPPHSLQTFFKRGFSLQRLR